MSTHEAVILSTQLVQHQQNGRLSPVQHPRRDFNQIGLKGRKGLAKQEGGGREGVVTASNPQKSPS